MLSFGIEVNCVKKSLTLALVFLVTITTISVQAIETIDVIGNGSGMSGLDYEQYMSNLSTASQLRSLYEGLALAASAAAKEAAEKEKSEEQKAKNEREKCEALAVVKNQQCLRDAVGYKAFNNKPCQALQATVGNMPYGNPAGACYSRVLDQYDIFVANCGLFHSTNMLACIK